MMNKIRIAVFGISDTILQVIRNEINPRKAEIVLFLDNDKTKSGMKYMNIPVFMPTKGAFDEYSIDYILVAALSAYESVKKQLMGLGIYKKKIQVFVTADLCKYCLGSIDDIDIDFINRAYFEPHKMINYVKEYNKSYEAYCSFPAFSEEGKEEWFNSSSLISHALGGIVNGKRIMYSNSKEAFQYSLDNKFKLVECDVLGVVDGEWMLGHDYWHYYEAKKEKYTILSLRELLYLLQKEPEVRCLIDVKWDAESDYFACVDAIEELIETMAISDLNKQRLKSQVVMEVYNEAIIKYACQKNFQMIFTQYRNPDKERYMNTVNLCRKYGVKAVAMDINMIWNIAKFLPILLQKNIRIFAFSTDSVEDYHALREMGVTGVFTNYLTEKDIAVKEE